MNGHPVILQQRVEALPVLEHGESREVVCPGCPRKSSIARRIPQEQERIQPELEVSEIDPEQHGGQEQFDGSNGRQYSVVPF